MYKDSSNDAEYSKFLLLYIDVVSALMKFKRQIVVWLWEEFVLCPLL